jgi:hypothetical protein
MALASEQVRSVAIEAQEFPELSRRYQVYSVPKIVINDAFEFVGGLPEPQFVDTIVGAVTGDGVREVEGGEQTPL